MKFIRTLFVLLSVIILFSCGQSQEKIDKQEKKNDSLIELERNSALNNADKLLKQQDSIDAANDTTAHVKK